MELAQTLFMGLRLDHILCLQGVHTFWTLRLEGGPQQKQFICLAGHINSSLLFLRVLSHWSLCRRRQKAKSAVTAGGPGEQIGCEDGELSRKRQSNSDNEHIMAKEESDDRTGSASGRQAAVSERNASLLGWVSLPVLPSPQLAGPASGASADQCGGASFSSRCGVGGGGDCTARNESVVGGEVDVARDGSGARATSRAPSNVDDDKVDRGTRDEVSVDARAEEARKEFKKEGAAPMTGMGQGLALVGAGELAENGVLRAGHGRVWFHAPSARLAVALPKDWVAVDEVSGGILADVSRFR